MLNIFDQCDQADVWQESPVEEAGSEMFELKVQLQKT